MIIQATYGNKSACYQAVVDTLMPLYIGDTIEITGMMIEDRSVEPEVVKALIHAAREKTDRNFRVDVVCDKPVYAFDGWKTITTDATSLLVTCTG